MADKPEYVDLISEATAQSYRRSMPRIVDLPTSPKETRRLSNENFRLANVDSLTDLPNRRQFRAYLQPAIDRAVRNGHQLWVLYVDFDGFAQFIDTLGGVTIHVPAEYVGAVLAPALETVQRVLHERSLPDDLQRKLLEAVDDLERTVRIRARYAVREE